jgi:hypothetical protein
MKSSLFAILVALSVVSPIASATIAIAAPAKSVVTNSPWQPIARITPGRPYQMQILNQTGTTLEYGSTTSEFQPRKLAPGSSATVAQLPASVFMLISPVDARFNLKYTVTARNNLITVRVTQLPENQPGNTTVNVQETGGIYVY